MNSYKVLNTSRFQNGNYSLVPIRYEDRWSILKWRNEQIYHLRQPKPLTKSDQEHYFTNVVSKLFQADAPSQILFSFLKDEVCIGYGGLVHINWTDKNAELSFIMDTSLEQDNFHKIWSNYLFLIEQVAFNELNFHKIFTYAFDLRPHLYTMLEKNGFVKEATLPEHCLFDGEYKDVIIHGKRKMILKAAEMDDWQLLLDWRNDIDTRKNSHDKNIVDESNHKSWLKNVIDNPNRQLFIAYQNGFPIGTLRADFDSQIDGHELSWTVAPLARGKGYGKRMVLQLANHINGNVRAEIKDGNTSSIKIAEAVGMRFKEKKAGVLYYSNFI